MAPFERWFVLHWTWRVDHITHTHTHTDTRLWGERLQETICRPVWIVLENLCAKQRCRLGKRKPSSGLTVAGIRKPWMTWVSWARLEPVTIVPRLLFEECLTADWPSIDILKSVPLHRKRWLMMWICCEKTGNLVTCSPLTGLDPRPWCLGASAPTENALGWIWVMFDSREVHMFLGP